MRSRSRIRAPTLLCGQLSVRMNSSSSSSLPIADSIPSSPRKSQTRDRLVDRRRQRPLQRRIDQVEESCLDASNRQPETPQQPHNRFGLPASTSARPHTPTSLAASSAPPPATTGSPTTESAPGTIGVVPPNPSDIPKVRLEPISLRVPLSPGVHFLAVEAGVLSACVQSHERHFPTGVGAAEAALSYQRRRLL